jgi:hypothetical protein
LIKTGMKSSYFECPVCVCVRKTIKRILKQEVKVCVTSPDCVLINGVFFWLPTQVTDFLRLHDKGKPVEPMTFELEIPDGFSFAYQKSKRF